METEVNLPAAIPVMTLPRTVLFPHALLPLHIFEPRYRQMLRDVLAADRIFAVAQLDRTLAGEAAGGFEPAHRIATAGIVRASQQDSDGTSDLLLQGLGRVEITGILQEHPYRLVSIRPLASTPGAAADENGRLRQQLLRLLALKWKFGAPAAGELAAFLRTVADPAVFADVAAFGFCEDLAVKQTLLETLDLHRRLKLFAAQIRTEIEAIKLRRKLQGRLGDDAITNN